MPTINNGANTEHSMEHAREQLDRLNLVDVPNEEVGKRKKERKRKAVSSSGYIWPPECI